MDSLSNRSQRQESSRFQKGIAVGRFFGLYGNWREIKQDDRVTEQRERSDDLTKDIEDE